MHSTIGKHKPCHIMQNSISKIYSQEQSIWEDTIRDEGSTASLDYTTSPCHKALVKGKPGPFAHCDSVIMNRTEPGNIFASITRQATPYNSGQFDEANHFTMHRQGTISISFTAGVDLTKHFRVFFLVWKKTVFFIFQLL